MIVDENATADEFRTAMAALHVGETIKITGANRHAVADALLIDNLDLTDAAIVDIGASDGSTAVDLIPKLPAFKSYVIADLFLTITASRVFRHVLFYDPAGKCILISGSRCVAWPAGSKMIRLLYWSLIRLAARKPVDRQVILLLNPSARSLIAADKRVSYVVHDVFDRWAGPAPDVIKVANLLRRLYFSDQEISRALHALLESLDEGGHLLIVDNPRIKDVGPRAGLYRRSQGRFAVVAQTDDPPEIVDLVLQVRLDNQLASQPTLRRQIS